MDMLLGFMVWVDLPGGASSFLAIALILPSQSLQVFSVFLHAQNILHHLMPLFSLHSLCRECLGWLRATRLGELPSQCGLSVQPPALPVILVVLLAVPCGF